MNFNFFIHLIHYPNHLFNIFFDRRSAHTDIIIRPCLGMDKGSIFNIGSIQLLKRWCLRIKPSSIARFLRMGLLTANSFCQQFFNSRKAVGAVARAALNNHTYGETSVAGIPLRISHLFIWAAWQRGRHREPLLRAAFMLALRHAVGDGDSAVRCHHHPYLRHSALPSNILRRMAAQWRRYFAFYSAPFVHRVLWAFSTLFSNTTCNA
jgi:hypothetical protein